MSEPDIDLKGKEDLLTWLEEGLKNLVEGDPVSAAIIAINSKEEVMTGYYKADSRTKALFAHFLNGDALLDVVLDHIEDVKDALDELEEDGEEEVSK